MGLPDSTSCDGFQNGRLADHRGKVASGQILHPMPPREEFTRGGIGIDKARLPIEGHEGVRQGIKQHLSGVKTIPQLLAVSDPISVPVGERLP